MKCPHCLYSISPEIDTTSITKVNQDKWETTHYVCPNCNKCVISLIHLVFKGTSWKEEEVKYVYPKAINNQPLPVEVDDPVVISDYNEASLILSDSPKSSAALSRRCLQYILREKLKTKAKDLFDQIQEVIDGNLLPTDISEGLNAVRSIGNIAAHSQKSQSTGEIIDVEPHEAEWNIEILYDLIDYIYVRPTRFQKKKDELNQKLTDIGKPVI